MPVYVCVCSYVCVNVSASNKVRTMFTIQIYFTLHKYINEVKLICMHLLQASLLQKWLLEHTTAMLENIVHATSINHSHLHAATAQNSRRSRVPMTTDGDSESLSKLFNVRLWNDGIIFQELKTACQVMMNGIVKDCDVVFWQILVEPGGQELRDFQWSFISRAYHNCPIDVQNASHDTHKVVGYAFGNSDFSEISMEQINPPSELNVAPLGMEGVDCDQALVVSQEPGIKEYRGLDSFHHGDAHDSLDSTAGTRQFEACRQDMEEVGAIPQPGPRELLERGLEYLLPKPHVSRSPSANQDISQGSQQMGACFWRNYIAGHACSTAHLKCK